MPRCNLFGAQEPILGSGLLAGTKSLSTQRTGCRLILLIELVATAIDDLRTLLAQPMSGSFALMTGWVRVDRRVFAHSLATPRSVRKRLRPSAWKSGTGHAIIAVTSPRGIWPRYMFSAIGAAPMRRMSICTRISAPSCPRSQGRTPMWHCRPCRSRFRMLPRLRQKPAGIEMHDMSAPRPYLLDESPGAAGLADIGAVP